MVADNSNSVFSVHPQEPHSNTRFLISGPKKDLHATFAGIKSELVMPGECNSFHKVPYCPDSQVYT